jgi:FtsP/CotA-like multicopper oxidase with cupredoxin domain
MKQLHWSLTAMVHAFALVFGLISVVTAAQTSNQSAKSGDERPAFQSPPDISSKDGSLTLELTAALKTIEVGGKQVTTYLYNGLFAPPTLHVRPGDKLLLKLNNKRDGNTNLHYHGTNVSPKEPQDNVYIRIAPKDSYQYEVDFPKDHPQGLFLVSPALARYNRVSDRGWYVWTAER